MALGHCRHRIHSLGWSIVMFFLIYWACIDEPWVSLVTRVQSAIKKRSNLLKNVSFTQAELHIWAATALPPSIMNTPPAWQMGKAVASVFVPHTLGPCLRLHQCWSMEKWSSPRLRKTSPGEGPNLPVLLTDGWPSDWVQKRKSTEKISSSLATVNVPHMAVPAPQTWEDRLGGTSAEGKGVLCFAFGVLLCTWRSAKSPQ